MTGGTIPHRYKVQSTLANMDMDNPDLSVIRTFVRLNFACTMQTPLFKTDLALMRTKLMRTNRCATTRAHCTRVQGMEVPRSQNHTYSYLMGANT